MIFPRLTSPISLLALSAGLAHADTLPSFGALEFGLEDTLFVADSAAGTISAYDLPNVGAPPAEDKAFNILDLDALVAEALGAEWRILYNDLDLRLKAPPTRRCRFGATFRPPPSPSPIWTL